MERLLSRFKRNEAGASAVEFALISAVLSVVFLNIFDVALFAVRKMEVINSVRAGVQYALLNRTSATAEGIERAVLSSSQLRPITVSVDNALCGCAGGGGVFACAGGTCATAPSGRLQYYMNIRSSFTHDWYFYPGSIDISSDALVRVR